MWATMWATEDAGGEGPYGSAVASAAIRDHRVPQPAGTHAINSEGVGAKTTNVGHVGERKEARDGIAVANATTMTARTVNDATTT